MASENDIQITEWAQNPPPVIPEDPELLARIAAYREQYGVIVVDGNENSLRVLPGDIVRVPIIEEMEWDRADCELNLFQSLALIFAVLAAFGLIMWMTYDLLSGK